jgi:mono/diheme cytochrome c family protein
MFLIGAMIRVAAQGARWRQFVLPLIFVIRHRSRSAIVCVVVALIDLPAHQFSSVARRNQVKPLKAITILLALGLTTLSVASRAADSIDLGKREYLNNCAVCHGLQGRGDGPYSGLVNTRMGDLSRLSSGNGGVFPVARIYGVLDGSRMSKGHGTTEMPIWGNMYKIKAAENYVDVPSYDPDAFVRARILALIDYLARLQEK